jgi:hypothetical protein
MNTVEQFKAALKSGEYHGVNIMEALCTIENQQRQIAELTHTLNELYEITDEVWRNEGLELVRHLKLRNVLKKVDKILEGN